VLARKSERGRMTSEDRESETQVGSMYAFRPVDQGVFSTSRLEMFIDAILAIALTVLVLNLSVSQEIGEQGLAHEVMRQRWTIAGVLLGFLWISGVWLLNLQIFRTMRGVDHYAMLLTVAWALDITLMPFATLILARGFGRSDLWVGVEAVGVVSLVGTLLSFALIAYSFRRGLMVRELSAVDQKLAEVAWLVAVTILVIVVAIAWFAPWIAFALLVLNWINVLLPSRYGARGRFGDLGRTTSPARDNSKFD
jgi:uncharacterized membrane protein